MSKRYSDIETWEEWIISQVKANLNTHIAEITSAKDDGITLDSIAHYNSDIATDQAPQANFVLEYSVNVEDAELETFPVLQANIELAIVYKPIAATNSSNPTLRKQLLRYQKALTKCFNNIYECESTHTYNYLFNFAEKKAGIIINNNGLTNK
jgi:hypothetical protein